VITSLSPEFAIEVRDLLIRPPAEDPYNTLKTELIKRTATSEQRKLQQLISGEDLGDWKPTQLLQRMQQLLGDHLGPAADNNSFLKELFLQRLLPNVRMVLASPDEKTDLAKLADMVDKIIKVAAPSVSAISRTTSDAEIEKLWAEVTRLADLVNSLTQHRPRRDRSESRGCHSKAPPPQLGKRLGAAGETPRPDTHGDKCHRPKSKLPLFCQRLTHTHTLSY